MMDGKHLGVYYVSHSKPWRVGADDSVLASASWDSTVRLWNVYSGDKSATDILQHAHEVLAVAFDPSGKTLACSTLNGEIHFWDARDAVLKGTIEARRDIRGGRLASDRRTAGNMASGQVRALARTDDTGVLRVSASHAHTDSITSLQHVRHVHTSEHCPC